MIDGQHLERAIAEFRPFLTSDGGDLRLEGIDEASGTVSLRVVIGPDACRDCIVEPGMLHEIITEFLVGQSVDGLRGVRVLDPRSSEGELK